jgi:hypothetical protein
VKALALIGVMFLTVRCVAAPPPPVPYPPLPPSYGWQPPAEEPQGRVA